MKIQSNPTDHADVFVDVMNTFVRRRFIETRRDNFLYGKRNTILASQRHNGSTAFDSLVGIFNLENATVGRELRCT